MVVARRYQRLGTPEHMAAAHGRARRYMRPESTLDVKNWLDQAACKGAPSAVFYPTMLPGQPDTAYVEQYDEARRTCASCPVIDQCAEEARKSDAAFGVWGFWAGMTPEERKADSKKSCQTCGRTFHARRRQRYCDDPECRARTRVEASDRGRGGSA